MVPAAPLPEMLPFTVSGPPGLVMLTPLVIVPAVMGPVSVSPPATFTVRLKAPPRVTAPRMVMELVPVPLGTSAMELRGIRRQRPGGDPRVQVLRHRPRDVPRAQHHRARGADGAQGHRAGVLDGHRRGAGVGRAQRPRAKVDRVAPSVDEDRARARVHRGPRRLRHPSGTP